MNCLEGLDWVDFNDRLNDVLDALGISADVYSSVCNIRQGFNRRTVYNYESRGFQNIWLKTGDQYDYMNAIGRVAPASDYPSGTPGLYTRRRKAVAQR